MGYLLYQLVSRISSISNLRQDSLDLLQTFERLPLPTLLRPLDVSAQLRLQRAARGGVQNNDLVRRNAGFAYGRLM